MYIRDLTNLIDYPDDVTVQIYSFLEEDNVYIGVEEDIPDSLKSAKIRGFEIPEKNCILINID